MYKRQDGNHQDIEFTVTVDGAAPVTLTISSGVIGDNNSLGDLVDDFNDVITASVLPSGGTSTSITDPDDRYHDKALWASRVGNRIRLQTVDQGRDTTLTLTGLNQVATDELYFQEGQIGVGLLTVDYNGQDFFAGWRDTTGTQLIEQYRISGLAGNDLLGFAAGPFAPDVSELSARSNDWVGVIDAGSGDDVTRVGLNADATWHGSDSSSSEEEEEGQGEEELVEAGGCLLYTSDAADE